MLGVECGGVIADGDDVVLCKVCAVEGEIASRTFAETSMYWVFTPVHPSMASAIESWSYSTQRSDLLHLNSPSSLLVVQQYELQSYLVSNDFPQMKHALQ